MLDAYTTNIDKILANADAICDNIAAHLHRQSTETQRITEHVIMQTGNCASLKTDLTAAVNQMKTEEVRLKQEFNRIQQSTLQIVRKSIDHGPSRETSEKMARQTKELMLALEKV